MNLRVIRRHALSTRQALMLLGLTSGDASPDAFRDFGEPWRGMALRLLKTDDLDDRLDLFESMAAKLQPEHARELYRGLTDADRPLLTLEENWPRTV